MHLTLHSSVYMRAQHFFLLSFQWLLPNKDQDNFFVCGGISEYELFTVGPSYPTWSLLVIEAGGPQSFVVCLDGVCCKKNSVGGDHLLPTVACH